MILLLFPHNLPKIFPLNVKDEVKSFAQFWLQNFDATYEKFQHLRTQKDTFEDDCFKAF